MSVVSLNFDTETKKMTVTMDGRTLNNIKRAEFYNYYDEEGFTASLYQVDTSRDDMTTTTVTNAENKDKKKKKNKWKG